MKLPLVALVSVLGLSACQTVKVDYQTKPTPKATIFII